MKKIFLLILIGHCFLHASADASLTTSDYAPHPSRHDSHTFALSSNSLDYNYNYNKHP